MNKNVVFACILTLVSGESLADSSQCEGNFTVDGGFFSGKTYKTWADFPNVKPNSAFKKVYAQTVKDGWKISQADKDMGVISASQTVSYGNGKTAPLNIVVEKNGIGSKVSITYSTSGGVSSPEDAVKKDFCATLSSVDNNQ